MTKITSRTVFYNLIFISLAYCSICKSLACSLVWNVVIILLFFAVFHYNPSFVVLGPNQLVRHETVSKKVVVNNPPRTVVLLVIVLEAWKTYESFLWLVDFSHFEKIMQAINKLLGLSVCV